MCNHQSLVRTVRGVGYLIADERDSIGSAGH